MRPPSKSINPIADGARQPCAASNGPLKHAGATGHIAEQASGPLTNVQSRHFHLIAFRSSAAARSCSLASCVMSRLNHQRSERIARLFSSFVSMAASLFFLPVLETATDGNTQ